MGGWIDEFLAAEALPASFRRTVRMVCEPLAERAAALRRRSGRTVLIGLGGAQGSGKSTVAAATSKLLEEKRFSAIALSLDDFYLPHAARQRLAREVHPLLITRGPPGTHDVALAAAVLDKLTGQGEVALPAFDKATDDRRPPAAWRKVAAPADVVLFEGWCVGARPQEPAALAEPVNALEAEEDPHGAWRSFVNHQLAGPYQALFARLDEVVLLHAPSFEVVAGWRAEQEAKLRARAGRGLSGAELARFIAHYERLTRWMLSEMPARADLVIRLAADRTPESV